MARTALKSVIKMINESKIELPVERSFLNDLKHSIEMTADKNRRPGSKSYKPSSMNCLRQMYYMVTGAEKEEGLDTYTSVGICNSGSDIHQRIQQAVLDMKANGIDCEYVNVADYVRSRNLDYLEIVKEPDFEHGEYETKLFHKTLNMSFLCDGIIKYKGIYYILELKTESANKFFARQGVDASHFNQGTAYSLALQIPKVLFVYISRDVLDMKSFMFEPTDDMKAVLVGKMELCDEFVSQFEVPPRPIDVIKKACEYCAYRERCRQDG